MSGTLFDGLESEDYTSLYGEDWDDSIEGLYDDGDSGESDFGDFTSGEAQQSAYSRNLQQARRRKELQKRNRALAVARARGTYQRNAAIQPQRVTSSTQVNQGLQQARAGIEKVDLENKVQTDVFSSVMRKQRERIKGSEYALATSTLLGEIKEQFPELFQGQFGTLVPFASLLLLKPDDNGKTGFEKYLNDPRFLFPALALGLKLFRENRAQTQRVTVSPSSIDLRPTESVPLVALDRNNQPFPANVVQWNSLDSTIAEVDKFSGKVTAKSAGFASIEAIVTVNGVVISNRAMVHVITP